MAVLSLMVSGYAMAAAAEQAVKGAAGVATESVKGAAKDTAKESASKTAKGALAPEQKVNINTATAAELAKLPGIGKKIAEDIVAYREKTGPFNSTQELKNVKGVGEKKYQSLKDKITVE
jgi:competence protein ComEA